MDKASSSSSSASMERKDPRTIARKYQLDLCRKAMDENIIVYLGTGCGKTHIAVLLMHELGHLIRKPSNQICVFLAPTIPLVRQQAIVIENSTGFKVCCYYGSSKRLRDHNEWKEETETFEVFVMTPQIFLHNLSHCYMKMELISLLIFDECHHAQAQKRHPYAQIMKEFYDKEDPNRPRILGMTASPIVGKGGSNQMNYTKSINSLEELLDAKVCSVEEDDLELNSVIASPVVKVYFYGPINHSASLLTTNYRTELENLKSECLAVMSGKLSDVKDYQKGMKSLWKLHDNLLFCLENLGLFGAIQAAKKMLANDGLDLEEELDFTNGDSSFRNLYLSKSIALLSDGLYDDATTDGSFVPETFEEPFFSQKLLLLIEILSRFNTQETTKCIIFVKRIALAQSLAYVLGKLSCLEFWKSEFLVGCNSGSKNMSRQKMNAIVQRFCSGEVNLLVATSVAEEGLDIQTCCLVIRFDLPETITSFIQSRGRARMIKSKYIFLLEKDNQQHEKLIETYRSGENKMNNEIGKRTSSETFEPLEELTYKVESTGASISTGSSVSLLNRYCGNLPRDIYFTPIPNYIYMDDLQGVICRIILPPNAAVRQVDSEPCPSKDLAKRNACLIACERLHDLGALNEYLLPDVVSKKSGASSHLSTASNTTEDENMREELHEMRVPEILKQSWPSDINNNNKVTMHFYYIEFMPVPNDRDYRMFGLFLTSKLPDEAEELKVDLHLYHGRIVRTGLRHLGLMSFNPDQMKIAQQFQEMWLKAILDRSEFASERVSLGKLEALFRHEGSTFYLLLPVKQQNYGESHNKLLVDWDTMRLCLSSPVFGNDANNQLLRGDCANSDDCLRLKNGVFKKRDLVGSLVYMPHNGLFFFVDGILHEMDASSAIQSSGTFNEYFKDKFNVQLLHPEQPLLKAKQLFNMRNLLHNRVQDKTDARKLEEHFVELPPEICCLKILGFSKDIGSSLSLLPSLMHRLENLLVAIELKHLMLSSYPQASQIPANSILEAITTEKCMERFSLERFEVLGDAFLKYTVGRHSFLSYESLDEGQLTRKRSSIVNNQNLYELAVQKKLQVFIRDQLFDPSQFFPLGRPCPNICSIETKSFIHSRKPNSTPNSTPTYSEKPEKCTGSHHWLHRKTIADVIESLVGLFLVESGFRSAIAFLKWIGIETEFEIRDLKKACELSYGNLSVVELVNFEALEGIMKHEFKFKGLLMQALIHPSYNKHAGGCYQKLEFLGDAVLEYLITSYLYSSYPDLKPGQLTDLRSASVNNISLAHVAVRLALHKFLVKDSTSLSSAVGKFERYARLEESERDLVDEPACPKVLGDIVESCVGALLLDTSFNLPRVWDLMLSLLEPALAFSSLHINPVRELRELCQSTGFALRFPDPVKLKNKEVYSVNVEVGLDDGVVVCTTAVNRNSKAARKLAAQEALVKLKSHGYKHKNKTLEEVLRTTRKNEAKLIGFDEEPIEIETGISIPEFECSKLGIEAEEQSNPNSKIGNNSNPNSEIGSSDNGDGISGDATCKTARTRLFEICQANYWEPPLFDCVNVEGPPHLQMFTFKVTLKIRGVKSEFVECFGEPKAKKKYAQESASEGALWYLKKLGIMP
ncbi:hypothetical protein LUZ60_017180 [Juncus effusus]|nr:hypothetical protein LUZ60_017180 [Juncus effusus]